MARSATSAAAPAAASGPRQLGPCRQEATACGTHRVEQLAQAVAKLDGHHRGKGVGLVVNLDHRLRHVGGAVARGRCHPAGDRERCPRVGKALAAAAAGGPERRHRPCCNVHCAAGIAWLAVAVPETRQPETRGRPERGLLRHGPWAPALASGSRGGCSAACERGGAPRPCSREGGQGRRG